MTATPTQLLTELERKHSMVTSSGSYIGAIPVKGINIVRVVKPSTYIHERILRTHETYNSLTSADKELILYGAHFIMTPDEPNAACVGSPRPFVGMVTGYAVHNFTVMWDHPEWSPIHRKLPTTTKEKPKFVFTKTMKTVHTASLVLLHRRQQGGILQPWGAGCEAKVLV